MVVVVVVVVVVVGERTHVELFCSLCVGSVGRRRDTASGRLRQLVRGMVRLLII